MYKENDHPIRQARSSDTAAWRRLRRSLWPNCPEDKHRLEMDQFLNSQGVVLLAENDDGEVIGLAEVSLRRDHVVTFLKKLNRQAAENGEPGIGAPDGRPQ